MKNANRKPQTKNREEVFEVSCPSRGIFYRRYHTLAKALVARDALKARGAWDAFVYDYANDAVVVAC